MKNKRLLLIISVVTLIAMLIAGSTFSFLQWASTNEQRTNVTFSANKNFSCSVDGGGNITSNDVTLIPTSDCGHASYAIKREIITNVVNNRGTSIYLNLWLDINALSSGLSNSQNFRYVLSTSSSSCSGSDVVNEGTFYSKSAGDKINLLANAPYASSTTGTYYLYIWLDYEGKDSGSQDSQFDLSLGGECTDYNEIPNSPYIAYDNESEDYKNIIPVVLSEDGTTATVVSKNDPNWYDYANKKWANAIVDFSTFDYSEDEYLENEFSIYPNSYECRALFVWIPRYSYKLNYNTGSIDIKFITPNQKDNGSNYDEWITPKAFTFGNDELSGIWVSKFRVTNDTYIGSTDDYFNNSILSLPHKKLEIYNNAYPSVASLFWLIKRSNDLFDLDYYDIHMAKMSEYEAIAIFAYSMYGSNSDNGIAGYYYGSFTGANNGNYLNGGYGTNSQGLYPQSTTGNATGVFDLGERSGNLYLMANYNDLIGNSGFSTLPNSKYYDLINNPAFADDDILYAFFNTYFYIFYSDYGLSSSTPWISLNSNDFHAVDGSENVNNSPTFAVIAGVPDLINEDENAWGN